MSATVTFGLSYTVRPGQEETFISTFERVVTALEREPGHHRTLLYRQVDRPESFMLYSEWASREDFERFIASEAFHAVKEWGRSEILAERPHHRVFTR